MRCSGVDRAVELLTVLARTTGWQYADDTREMHDHIDAEITLARLPAGVVAQARLERAGQLRLPL